MNVDQLEAVSTSLSPRARSEALRKVVVLLKQHLREEDILARLDGTIFALMLPDVTEEEAKAMMEKLQTRIAWTPFEIEKNGLKLNLCSAAGVVAYRYNGTGQDEFLAEAGHLLLDELACPDWRLRADGSCLRVLVRSADLKDLPARLHARLFPA